MWSAIYIGTYSIMMVELVTWISAFPKSIAWQLGKCRQVTYLLSFNLSQRRGIASVAIPSHFCSSWGARLSCSSSPLWECFGFGPSHLLLVPWQYQLSAIKCTGKYLYIKNLSSQKTRPGKNPKSRGSLYSSSLKSSTGNWKCSARNEKYLERNSKSSARM